MKEGRYTEAEIEDFAGAAVWRDGYCILPKLEIYQAFAS